ncbi:YitT family protein [Brevibacillus sp. NPDC058079]|uniref:YitT family protein n=1 Tax=Brevibacillus sp. NPDC058079 TaxID=3346330 RepID=UPI0036EC46AA
MVDKKHNGLSVLTIIQRIIAITIGGLLMSVGLNVFLIPNQVFDGGIAGVSIIMSHLTGIGLGLFLFILHIPFVYIGYKQIGKTFAMSTAYGISVLSISTAFMHGVEPFTHDVLLATVFGGIIGGVGVGIAIRYGGCLDGVEILAILFNKKLPFSVGEIIMFINLFILGSGGFVFGWDRAMYSLIAYFIAFKVIDVVVEGFDEMKSAWIISDHHEEMKEAIMHRLGRGTTYLNGEGGFSGDGKKILICYIARLEEAKLKTIIDEIDENALLAISHVSELRGANFKKNDIH